MTIGNETKDATTPSSAQKLVDLDAVGTVLVTIYDHDTYGSATLINDKLVLTAGHNFCIGNPGNATGTIRCNERANFTLHNVIPTDNPNTTENESLTHKDVTIGGNVRVNPYYNKSGVCGDLAVIELDKPSSELVKNVTPIAVENPKNYSLKSGDNLTAVGFGNTGECCGILNYERKTARITVDQFFAEGFIYTSDIMLCGGDSGGPLIDKYGHVVGVISKFCNPTNTSCSCTGELCSTNNNYDSYNWIFNGTSGQNETDMQGWGLINSNRNLLKYKKITNCSR